MLMVTFVQSDVKIYLCVQARGGFFRCGAVCWESAAGCLNFAGEELGEDMYNVRND